MAGATGEAHPGEQTVRHRLAEALLPEDGLLNSIDRQPEVSMSTQSLRGAKAISLLFGVLVLREYRGLMYPHPGWLFHLHITAATGFVVLLVHATCWSVEAGMLQGDEKLRRSKLVWHRYGMSGLVFVLTGGTAGLMLYKKWKGGLGFLLLSGRMPSYHSWSWLGWAGLAVFMALSGLLIHTAVDPPAVLKSLAVRVYGSIGKARLSLRALHNWVGLVAFSVGLMLAGLGLTEKNNDPSKEMLAWFLGLIWIMVTLPAVGSLMNRPTKANKAN